MTRLLHTSKSVAVLLKILMHVPKRSKYPFVSIHEAFKCAFSMKQKDNENLLDYSKHLKQAKDILEEHVGKDIM